MSWVPIISSLATVELLNKQADPCCSWVIVCPRLATAGVSTQSVVRMAAMGTRRRGTLQTRSSTCLEGLPTTALWIPFGGWILSRQVQSPPPQQQEPRLYEIGKFLVVAEESQYLIYQAGPAVTSSSSASVSTSRQYVQTCPFQFLLADLNSTWQCSFRACLPCANWIGWGSRDLH